MFCLFGFFCLFCLIFIGRYTDVRQENASVRSHNRSHGTNYWNESGCWGENDMQRRWKQILFWGEFREQLLDLQMVSWLLFWAAFTGPIVEDWQVGNRADPAPVPRLVLLHTKCRHWCFCWGRIPVGTSSRNHTGILTATCKETSRLLAAVSKNQKTQNTSYKPYRESGRLTSVWPLLLLTPSWIYNHLNFLDGQTDNFISVNY